MLYRLRFGDYDLPPTLRPANGSDDNDTAPQSVPRRSGSITQAPRRTPATFQVRGELAAASLAALDTLTQALRAATLGGGKKSFWFGTDARYWRDAVCKGFSADHKDGITFGVIGSYSLTFEASDFPEAFDAATTTSAVATGISSLTPGGDTLTLPTWSFTLSSGGPGTIQLANAATGETMRLSVPASATSGQVIAVNRETNLVTLGGVSVPSMLRGRVPALSGGVANAMTLTLTTITISEASVDYQARYT